MPTEALTLKEIYALASECLTANGADGENAAALSNTIMTAERDGSYSHGLFRLPAYVASLRSGKVNGQARPKLTTNVSVVIKLHGDNGYAPMAHSVGIPALVKATEKNGIAMLAITHTHHMAALWPEVEAIAAHNLVGLACTPYMPFVAPAGASKPLFGTNPLAFAWPRPGKMPLVFDMATASMAMGEVQLAAREGHDVPAGTGLDKNGNETTNPKDIAEGGMLLPFGGYKGSAIAMMVELLAAGLVNENFSFEAKEHDIGDGGPPKGGQFILAISPAHVSGNYWEEHCEKFFEKLLDLEGVRLPGHRRHQNRLSQAPREIDSELLEKIRSLIVT